MKFVIFTLLIYSVFTFNSIAQTKNLSFKFNHTAAGQTLELNKTIFTIHNGKKVKLTRAEFYLSGVSLMASATDSFNVADAYVLVNANDPNKLHNVGTFPSNFTFSKVKMDVGIDKVKNHEDPALYPSSHPLGPKSPDMHWGWQAGYRFIALEGLVDNNKDGIPEQEFQIHSVGDALLFRTLLDLTPSHHIETEPMVINLDYEKLFNTMSMTGNLIQHGSSALNKTLLLNAANAGFINPLLFSATENGNLEELAIVEQNNRTFTIKFVDGLPLKEIEIYNINGMHLGTTTTNANEYKTELLEQPSGIYVFFISIGNKKHIKQYFVQ